MITLITDATQILGTSTNRKERITRIGKQLRSNDQTLRSVTLKATIQQPMDLVAKKIDFLHLVILFQFILLLYCITESFFHFCNIVILYLFLFSYRHRFQKVFFQKDKHVLVSYHTTLTNPIILLLSKLFQKEFLHFQSSLGRHIK